MMLGGLMGQCRRAHRRRKVIERYDVPDDRRHRPAHRALPLPQRRRPRRAPQPRLYALSRPLWFASRETPPDRTQRQRRDPLLVSLEGAMGCHWPLWTHRPARRRGSPFHRARGYLLGALLTLVQPKMRKVELSYTAISTTLTDVTRSSHRRQPAR